MRKDSFSNKLSNYIPQFIAGLFIFQSLFVTLRIFVVGSNTSSNAFETLISVLPDILIVALLMISIWVNKLNNLKITLFDYSMALYGIGSVILGFWLSNDLRISAYGFRLTYLPMLMYFVARLGLEKDKNVAQTHRIFDLLFGAFVVFCLLSLVFYLFLPYLDEKLIKFSGGKITYYAIRRMGGVFYSPVLWGTFACAGGLYQYYLLSKEYKHKRLLFFSILWFCLILSVSRGAYIGFYIGIFIITLVFRNFQALFRTSAASLAIFVLYGLFNPIAFALVGFVSSSSMQTFQMVSSEETHTLLDKSDSALVSGISNTRVRFWVLSYRDFKNKPMGYGLGKAGHIGQRFFNTPAQKGQAAIYSTDGWYLKLANETGFLGLIGYFLLFFYQVFLWLKYWSKIKEGIGVFFAAFIIAVAFQNIVSNVLDFYSFAGLYWLIVGLNHNLLEEQ